MSGRLRIDPGQLRERLLLQAPEATPDELGGFGQGWTDVATLDALVRPRSARSRFAADQPVSTLTHEIIIRRRPGVARGMRFVKAGRALTVRTVHDPDETGRYLLCGAEEDGA